jgi:DNA polymerase-3 subunit delta'
MKPWLHSQQQIFSDQFSRNMLPHAILINGVTGSGKLEFAQWLLHLLSCQKPQQISEQNGVLASCGQCKSCLLFKSKTYPDHLSLIAEKTSLGVDEIRYANGFLQKKAHLGKFKTVLIEHAQTMTQAAANALLKTLEEPSDNSVIVLLTNDIEMLLPTIISRCRVLNIRPKVGQALLQSMTDQGLTLNQELTTGVDNNFVNLTQLPELTNASINKAFQEFKTCYINYLYGQSLEPLLLEQLLNNEHSLRWIEQITVSLYREQFSGVLDTSNKSALDPELLNNLYKVIINGCKVTKSYTQANKQFVYEKLIMTISDVLEQAKINE